MTLVAGIDSSTQSCKVVVCDGRDGSGRPLGDRAASRGNRDRPGALAGWPCARPSRGRRAATMSPRSPSPRSSTGWSAWTSMGESSDRRCSGTTPARPTPPPSSSRSSAARSRADGRGPRRSEASPSRRSRSRSCGGLPSTSRRTPRGPVSVCLPHDWLTWQLGGALLGARARSERPRHRPRRRQRHRLLLARHRRVPPRSP